MNTQYRKKPVVIDAFQMTEARRASNDEWPDWLNQAWQLDRKHPGAVYPTVEGTGDGTLSIRTLEGEHLVSWGDWIIRGVAGELYPCKPDIFDKTYEPVIDTAATDLAGRLLHFARAFDVSGYTAEYVRLDRSLSCEVSNVLMRAFYVLKKE